MSRTFAFTTPTRRSKRLLQNGYYRVESTDVLNLLEAPASDDDDVASIDSNLSKLSYNSERQVMYKESRGKLFNHRPKKGSPSPNRQLSASMYDISEQQHSRQVLAARNVNRYFSHKDLATSSTTTVVSHENFKSNMDSSVSDTVLLKNQGLHHRHVVRDVLLSGEPNSMAQKTMQLKSGNGDGHFKTPLSTFKAKSKVKVSTVDRDCFLYHS